MILLFQQLLRLLHLLNPSKLDTDERNGALGCAYQVAKINFWQYDPSVIGFYATACSYAPALQTWTVCIHDSVRENGTFEESLVFVKDICSHINPTRFKKFEMNDYYETLNNGTKHMKDDLGSPMLNVTYPIRFNNTFRSNTLLAYHIHSRNLDIANQHAKCIYLYFLFVLFLATIANSIEHFALSKIVFKLRLLRWWRGHFILPTLTRNHAAYVEKFKIFIGLLPTRSEAIIITGYVIQHIWFLSYGYTYDPNNILFASTRLQKIRLLADRAGILSFGNIPLIILLSTRSNICEKLTNVKYSSLIMFHKWIGRVMGIDVFIHGGCYLGYAIMTGSFSFSVRQKYYQFGIIACFLAFFIMLFSFGIFRKHYYELFLYGHIILALFFFYSCWKHVEHLGWKEWIIAATVIWTSERMLRLLKLCNTGFPKAQLKIINKELIKVTIRKQHQISIHFKPGQHCFLYFMHPKIFWQSHPFTVLDNEDCITVVIRPKSGATGVIFRKLLESKDNVAEMRVGLEGPYGSFEPIHHSDSILLLGGGSGLPGPLSHALNLANKHDFNKTVELLIIVNTLSLLKAYKNEILKLKNSHTNITIYVTKPLVEGKAARIPGTHTPLLHDADILHDIKQFCTVQKGRPNIAASIEKAAQSSRSLSIVSCGPPQFVDLARKLVAKNVLSTSSCSIEYFEEFQCW
ncbi:putative ferric-chelate reductase KNAG_0E04240 [Huiozyma naganishii CBS 8797]|uniref:FAD-binding FR-type domain-containing protein n=1 Tax=Huiozyma naganishii (strain ATCC MYA-139 / BCRC 22969 / CBS 8797 / KCTC 17520 / NBRC 10181 / NCYC 3082 / Yp74L-3) TaxID=1071383 RepID=J7RZM1_HUIN7|nr:hypothetical protein KNAG_0E04240 [Kazachstania naganishii CBS 8797]CCK70677.1 hypothetical protein KNAG_0E04240 [Kazachstania naganishii CBS 8797]